MKKHLLFVLFSFFYVSAFAQPANDACADAQVVTAGEVVAFNTNGADTDGPFHPAATTPCPSNTNDSLFTDVWYTFTPEFTGLADWSLCGTADFDSKIAVYQPGSACPPIDGDLLACNDDGAGCANSTSRMIFNVTQGETYLLRLGGWGETAPGEFGSGSFVIDEFFTSLPNDFCFQATPIDLGMGQMFTNVDATTDGPDHPNDASCFGFNDITVQADIWFEYTATATATLEWSTCDQINFDSRLAVYAPGSSCPPVDADLYGCNDDGAGCSAFTSRMLFDVVEGETYLLRLGGFGGEQGSGTFDLFETDPPVPPANDLCVDADSAWIVTAQQYDDLVMPISGTTVNATFDPDNWVPPSAQCFGGTGDGEYATIWYWFNSYGNEQLDIAIFKDGNTTDAQFYIDVFESCGTLVDTNAIIGACLFADDTELFDITTVSGLPAEPTLYYVRVTTRLTTQLPGDFLMFIVGEITTSTTESYPGQFSVFPNPAKDALHLNLALNEQTNTNFRIVNSLGQTVLAEDKGKLGTGMHQFDFNLNGLSKGMYFLLIQSESGLSSVRFVKE